jgi:hypothetical protein
MTETWFNRDTEHNRYHHPDQEPTTMTTTTVRIELVIEHRTGTAAEVRDAIAEVVSDYAWSDEMDAADIDGRIEYSFTEVVSDWSDEMDAADIDQAIAKRLALTSIDPEVNP